MELTSERESRSYMPKSKSDEHITPEKVYLWIQHHWGFQKDDMFDPCPVGFMKDGLSFTWPELNYVNPPYTLLKEFVAKAMVEAFRGKRTIMLLPSKTDQGWFHDLIAGEYELHWIKGRLKFEGAKWSATQAHFLVMVK